LSNTIAGNIDTGYDKDEEEIEKKITDKKPAKK